MIISTIQMVIIYFMAGFDSKYFGQIYPIMLLQFWLVTAITQAVSAWSKTLVQAYTALWASTLVFFVFSGAQAPLGALTPSLRWIADVNPWRWCLQFVVSVPSTSKSARTHITVFLRSKAMGYSERNRHGLCTSSASVL